ncbi:MAG TPA: response regulator [Bryobacteraceae bacterium]|nr:response regulator [Bryobacteraceae bacterium]
MPDEGALPARELRHNLRTPVNHILGYTEMLMEDAGSLQLPEVVDELEQVRTAAHTLLAYINEGLGSGETISRAGLDGLCRRLEGPLDRILTLASSLEHRTRGRGPDEWAHDLGKMRAGAENLRGLIRNAPEGPEQGAAEADSGEGAPQARTGQARILVVDDNDTNRQMLRRRLERQGYGVGEAPDGRRALAALRAGSYDLVLLDIMMPEVDGFQVLQWMKEDSALRDVPVIVISALDELKSVVRSIEMGAEDYLFKPFDPVLLRARIGASLEKRRLRNELVVQEKLASLGALTAGVAHEIRNPLNFVNNFAQLSVELAGELKEKLGNLPEGARAPLCELAADLELNLRKILEHGTRAGSVVASMLLHSRGQSGERRPTDLNALVAEYVTLAYHGARAQDATLQACVTTKLDPAVGMVDVSPQDISRVFLNIAGNAFQSLRAKGAAAPGFEGALDVSTRDLGDRVEVRFRDNGVGIPEPHLPRIFDPFFTTKPAGEGTGLGLSLSYEIVVREHKGEVRAESREGQGAEFIVTLPKGIR